MRDPLGTANLLTGHAVAYATAYLDGRHDAEQLAGNADRLLLNLLAVGYPSTNALLDPARILAIVMMRAARTANAIAHGYADALADARLDHWQQIMGSLVELVRIESRRLVRDEEMQETRR